MLAGPLSLAFARILALTAAAAPTPTPGPPERAPASTTPDADAKPLEVVVLHARDLAGDDLRRDLELRSPGLTIELQAPGAPLELPAGRRWAYVLVRGIDEGAALTVILADGRAFDRQVPARADQAARAAASALANLLAAIAEDRVEADREDVTPTADLGAEAPPDADADAEPRTATDDAADRSTTATRERASTRDPAETPASPNAAALPPPRLSLVPELAPLVVLQLGPPRDAGIFGGGGFGLGLGLRTAAGARVGVDLRGLWNVRGGLALHRLRVGLRGGYELRRGRFALESDALIAVEPWFARFEGARIDVGPSRGDRAPALALALGVRVAPAIDLRVSPGDRLRLRLGLWTELTYAGVVDHGLRAARITLAGDGVADAAVLRLGGLELACGLLLAVPHAIGGR